MTLTAQVEFKVKEIGPGYLNKQHLAAYLDVSERTVDRLAASGALTGHVINGRRLFQIAEVERLLERGAGKRCERRPQRREADAH